MKVKHLLKAVPRHATVKAALATLGLVSMAAHALQPVDVRDGDTALVRVSVRDQTRIRVDGARIIDVLGDLYDEKRNPGGRLTLVKDEADGEIYVKPTPPSPDPLTGYPGSAQRLAPIKLDIKSTRGTFALLLQPTEVIGDTILVKPVGPVANRPAANDPSAPASKSPVHVRSIKALTLAMVSPELSGEVPAQVVPGGGRELALWREARYVLVSTQSTGQMVGETYRLTNIDSNTMVVDEREFFVDGVLSVSIKNMVLAPGESTPVWIIRQPSGNQP